MVVVFKISGNSLENMVVKKIFFIIKIAKVKILNIFKNNFNKNV